MSTLESDRRASAERMETVPHRMVWDWPLRVFHWALVAAIVGAFVTNRLGVKYFAYHAWCGYAVIVLIAFRLLWGVYGPRHARFANFVKGPGAVLRYLGAVSRGRRTRYAGHNPLGALMVVTLLGALLAQAAFGLFSDDEIFDAGPLAGLVSKGVSLDLTSLHRRIFYWIAAAIGIHIAAVVAHVAIKGENLIGAMITGRKAAHLVRPREEIRSSRGLRAIGLFVVVTAALALLLHLVPGGDGDVASF
jgi:cytochrome b